MPRRGLPPGNGPAYPPWAVLPYTLLGLVIVPVYWVEYGPLNFLWFSDIALFVTIWCLWTGHRLPASMMAVGVLPLELVWTADLLTGGALGGLAGYMFDEAYPLWLRALSLFHLPLLAVLVWILVRQGYDRRALGWQTLLAWVVLPLTYWLSGPDENINWVYHPGPDGTAPFGLTPPAYLGLYMLALPLFVYLPTHVLLRRLAGRED